MDVNPYAVIQSQYPAFSGIMKKIADYVLTDSDQIQSMSVQRLASTLSVAESSIVRFCKLLGFSGFAEFKMKLAKYSAGFSSSVYESVYDLDSAEQITRKIFALNCKTLQKAVELLDFTKVEDGARLIRQAEQIILCGIGMSASIAENFATHLMRIGMMADAVTDPELLLFVANLSCPGTLFIAVSKSGTQSSLVDAFRIARERGARTMCLTCYTGTPLEACSDVCIRHYFPPEELISTRVVQNTLVDCLITAATMDRQSDVIDLLAKNRQAKASLHLRYELPRPEPAPRQDREDPS
ncbi:MAG: MurR/RpiR family transcriptional regulator [Oscillibacter sp.]|nr:MurR/RpiR family transcriptional regulator [Oscillibacter sp.]